MREILKDGIQYIDVSSDTSIECHDVDVDVKSGTTSETIIYDFCGVLLHTRQNMIKCNACWKALQTSKEKLHNSFSNSELVAIRDKSGFKWATVELFETMKAVEDIFDLHFESQIAYVRNSF